jgi:uncharacterized protein YecT (DUF1311 family)
LELDICRKSRSIFADQPHGRNGMRIRAVTAILAVALASPVMADQEIDCSNANGWYERFFCADKEFTAADAELNAIYKALLAQVAKGDDDRYDAKTWEAALRTSQRAWVAFRDAECNGLVMMEFSGGTDQQAAAVICMTDLTKARIVSLKDRVLGPVAPAKVR